MIITLSGTDGVGKSTQLQRILTLLETQEIDYRVMYVRGGRTPISKLYRNIILKHRSNNALLRPMLYIGFLIAMFELMYYWIIKIRFLEKKGRVVVCDRYIWDTYVDFCHSYKLWNPNSYCWKYLLERIVIPDISILYVANTSVINDRLMKKNEQSSLEEIHLLNTTYESLYGMFNYVIDASEDEKAVFEKTKNILKANNTINDNTKFNKKILRKVRPFLNKQDAYAAQIRKIKKGNSTAQNYCVLIRNTPRYFVKVYDKKIKALPKLQQLSKQNNSLVTPIADFSIGFKRCMMIDWLDAENISGTPSEAYTVAEILKFMHSQKTFAKHHKSHIKLELKRYLLYFIARKVEFSHKQNIFSYLLQNSALCRKEYSLTHMDVHCRNFVIDSNAIIHLVDYENLCITDPWRDFVYACFFHDREENLFWDAVITKYFNDNIPEDFWITMKYYCYLHLLRMIICEHQKGNYENIDRLVNSIWESWNCYYDKLPRWKRQLSNV